MKLAIDAGDFSTVVPLAVAGGGELRPNSFTWLPFEDIAAAFRRMASWRRIEGFAGEETMGGVEETMGVGVWVFGCSPSGFECISMVLNCFSELCGVLLGSCD